MAGVAFGLAQKWQYVLYVCAMILPSIAIDVGLFTFQPFLDMPYIEWGKVLGLEQDEQYNEPNRPDGVVTFNDESQFF